MASGTDVAAAFEVEHTTFDLFAHVLVAPDSREDDVCDQLVRPAFRNKGLAVKFLPYGALDENRASMARFGTGIKPVEAIARVL